MRWATEKRDAAGLLTTEASHLEGENWNGLLATLKTIEASKDSERLKKMRVREAVYAASRLNLALTMPLETDALVVKIVQETPPDTMMGRFFQTARDTVRRVFGSTPPTAANGDPDVPPIATDPAIRNAMGRVREAMAGGDSDGEEGWESP